MKNAQSADALIIILAGIRNTDSAGGQMQNIHSVLIVLKKK